MSYNTVFVKSPIKSNNSEKCLKSPRQHVMWLDHIKFWNVVTISLYQPPNTRVVGYVSNGSHNTVVTWHRTQELSVNALLGNVFVDPITMEHSHAVVWWAQQRGRGLGWALSHWQTWVWRAWRWWRWLVCSCYGEQGNAENSLLVSRDVMRNCM